MRSKTVDGGQLAVDGGRWVVDSWAGCYPSNWKGSVVTEAMTHPAKFSSRLIRRIYEHIVAEGWVKAGDGVIDPFGGVGLGALDAMRLGLHWTGVELEEKFWKIGNENISLWNSRFGSMPRWGSARLLNGDSRKLLELAVDGGQLTVSSPPYGEGSAHTGGDDPHPERMEGGTFYGVGLMGAVSSPPYAEAIKNNEKGSGIDYSKAKDGGRRTAGRESIAFGYGKSAGQLGDMSASEDSFKVSISSPPFLQSEGGTPEPKAGGVIDAAMYERHKAGNKSAGGYGDSAGQLHHMPAGEGSFEGAVSSPPYEGMEVEKNAKSINRSRQYEAYKRSGGGQTFEQFCRTQDIHSQGYGESVGQLSQESGDDFWMAARVIVEQVYAALEPGGHAVWVVKDYVKAKQVVPFADQWRQLCEAVGFETVHEHRAMLVHYKGRQGTLDGGVHEVKTESKSFFRRLAEKKGSPRIDWEVVWCMVKPG